MDGDTRFLLANHVSQGRNVSDARDVFRDVKAVAKVESRVLLTNGLGSYGPVAQQEFPDAVHVAGVGLQGRLNNNRMERYHGDSYASLTCTGGGLGSLSPLCVDSLVGYEWY